MPEPSVQLAEGRLRPLAAGAGMRLFACILIYSLVSLVLFDPRFDGRWLFLLLPLLAGALVALLWMPGRLAARVGGLLAGVPVAAIVLLAAVLRLAWVTCSGAVPESDYLGYDQLAVSLAGGEWPTDPMWPLGAPIFFALHYRLLGHQILYPQVSLALLSTLQVYLTWRLVRAVGGQPPWGKWAALLLALWPEHILYTNLIGSDVLFATLVLLAVAGLVRRDGTASGLAGVFLCGLTLGAAQWVRTTALVFALAAGLYLLLSPHRGWQRLRRVAALLVGLLVLLAPLAWMNWKNYHVVSVMSKFGGWSLMEGTNIENRGQIDPNDYAVLDETIARDPWRPGETRAIQRSRVAFEIGMKRLTRRPAEYAGLAAKYKMASLWALPAGLGWSVWSSRIGGHIAAVKGVAGVYHVAMLLLSAAAGLRFGRPMLGKWSVLTVLIYAALGTTLLHCIVEAQDRYHHMFLPLLAVLAGCYFAASRGPDGGVASNPQSESPAGR